MLSSQLGLFALLRCFDFLQSSLLLFYPLRQLVHLIFLNFSQLLLALQDIVLLLLSLQGHPLEDIVHHLLIPLLLDHQQILELGLTALNGDFELLLIEHPVLGGFLHL